MSAATRACAEAAKKLLAIHESLSFGEWRRLSPAERKLIADTFAPENLETLRELASWDADDA